jgi:hypothetical protein
MAIQYTIRNIPPEVDMALKKRAKISKKSFNQVVVEELSKSTIKTKGDNRFGWLVGTMTDADAEAFDKALEDLNKPDEDFWK